MNIEKRTALYSPLDIEYQQEYSGPYEDVRIDGFVAGIKDGKITGFGRPVIGDGEIRELWNISQDIWYMDFLDGGLSENSRFLLSKGYQYNLYLTQVICLKEAIKVLRHNLRKSYKSLVNSFDYQKGTIDDFRQIHKEYHGYTRSDKSWDVQRKMDTVIYTDRARISGVMFYANKYWAYYASSAGTAHALIWRAMLELKRKGVLFCEMGEQVWDDTKLGNIANFKRGFGGKTYVRMLLCK
jgi:hypothetical protein